MKIKIPEKITEFGQVFNQNDFKIYLVGGGVRDSIMKKKPYDWDAATNAHPEEVQKLFKRTIPTGIQHGTVTVVFKGLHIEVTTFRGEGNYTDGRHPDRIFFADNIEDDLSRRDFTINAIAAEIPTGKLTDPFHGIRDIKEKIIRTVGNPNERFREDGLRLLRCIRFATTLNFKIDDSTMNSLYTEKNMVKKVASERIRDEFTKILMAEKPSVGLRLMETTGILELIIPELTKCRNVTQKGMHRFDVLDHLYYSVDGVSSRSLTVRLAALFHDVGKPDAKKTDEFQNATFYNHEKISAKITENILNRLHFPKVLIKDVCFLIEKHMFHYESRWKDSAVRRFLSGIKEETRENNENPRTLEMILEDLFELRLGDSYGLAGLYPNTDLTGEFRKRIRKEMEREQALGIKDLAVSGRDLQENGIPPGKHMGIILKELLDTVLEDPGMNTKEKLLNLSKNIYNKISITDNLV